MPCGTNLVYEGGPSRTGGLTRVLKLVIKVLFELPCLGTYILCLCTYTMLIYIIYYALVYEDSRTYMSIVQITIPYVYKQGISKRTFTTHSSGG